MPAGVALAACFAFAAAAASVPELSGAYLYKSEEICPATLVATQNSHGDLINLVTGAVGDVTVTILDLKLTPGSGTPDAGNVTGSGFQVELDGTLQGPGQTIASTDKAITVTGTFSNTANSLAIHGGETITYNALYGTLKSGIAQSASFTGLTTLQQGSPMVTVTCIQHGTLTHN